MPDRPTHTCLVDLDLTVEGTQFGYLRIHRMQGLEQSAVQIPLCTMAGGEGSGVLFLGVQGTPASRVLQRCQRAIADDPLSGRVTIVPALPVEPTALPTALAPLVDAADIVVMVGGADDSLAQAPTAFVRVSDKQERLHQAETLMFAMGAAHSLRLLAPPGSDPLAEFIEARGKLLVGCVPGNTAVGTAHAVHEATIGCINLLVQAGVLQRELELRASRILRLLPPEGSVFARHAGLLDLLRDPGQNVYRGSTLARIHVDGGVPDQAIDVLAPRDGVLLTTTTCGRIEPGECIGVVAEEMPA